MKASGINSLRGLGTIACSLGLCLGLFACGGTKMQGGAKDSDPLGKMMGKKADLAAKGIVASVASASSVDLQTAIDKVELDCRVQIARSLDSKVMSLQERFKEEVGGEYNDHFSSATKTVTSKVLVGTTLVENPYHKTEDGKYEVIGLMVLDPKIFKDALAEELSAEQAMKTRFMASKAYADLDKEAKDYDEYKKGMTPPASGQ